MNNISKKSRFDKDWANVRQVCSKIRRQQSEYALKKNMGHKLLPIERVERLVDDPDWCMPLSELCGTYKYQGHCGVLSYIAAVEGYTCVILANDYTQKGGMLTPMGVEKILRSFDIALEHRWPIIFYVESAGADLHDQLKVYSRTGQIYSKMAKLTHAGVPILSVVNGSSTAGGAYIPGMSSYVVMVEGAEVYLAGPPLVEAATGLSVDGQSLGGIEVHQDSGLIDEVVASDVMAIPRIKEWVKKQSFNSMVSKTPILSKGSLMPYAIYDFDETLDFDSMFEAFFDDGQFDLWCDHEGIDVVAAEGLIGGEFCGVMSNRGPFSTQGSLKASRFIDHCDKRKIPLIFLTNTPGFMVGPSTERSGIIDAGSSILKSLVSSKISKYVFVLGGSYGAGSYAMCHRSFQPSFIFSWPNSRLAVMGGRSAVKVFDVLSKNKGKKYCDKRKQDLLLQYEKESNPLCTSSFLLDDGVIHPDDTRAYFIKLRRFAASYIKELVC